MHKEQVEPALLTHEGRSYNDLFKHRANYTKFPQWWVKHLCGWLSASCWRPHRIWTTTRGSQSRNTNISQWQKASSITPRWYVFNITNLSSLAAFWYAWIELNNINPYYIKLYLTFKSCSFSSSGRPFFRQFRPWSLLCLL